MSFIFVVVSKPPFIMCLSLIFLVAVLGLLLHTLGIIWLIYTLIIIFLGGIIIVFVYAASVNNSFKIYIPYALITFITLFFNFIILPYFLSYEIINQNNPAIWIFSSSSSFRYIIFLSLIILLRLFIIVKIVQIERGPLKM